MRAALVGAVLAALLASCNASEFQLPLMEGADPFVTREGNDYYVMITRFVDIAILRVQDLNDLDSATPHIVFCADAGFVQPEIWAPELIKINGRWFIYATALRDERRGLGPGSDQFVLESVNSSNPLGPYRWRGWLNTESGIDGTVLQWRGKLYYIWSRFSWEVPQGSPPQQVLTIAPMQNPWTLELEQQQTLSQPWHDWEKVGNRVNEGPAVLHRDGRLFLLYSASLCWTPDYKLGLLEFKGTTQRDILDYRQWEKSHLPVLQKSEYNGVWGPGHCSVTTTPDGRWLMMYHTKASEEWGEGRLVNAMEFGWDEEGRPMFGRPSGVPPRYTFPGQRKPHATLHWKEQPLTCSAVMAPTTSPTELDWEWRYEAAQRRLLGDRVTWAVFVVALAGMLLLHWRSKSGAGAAGGNGGGGSWALLPRAPHGPIHRS